MKKNCTQGGLWWLLWYIFKYIIILSNIRNFILKEIPLFLGIFYIVDYFLKAVNLFFIGFATTFKPFITFFKYVSLGCYYTLYGLLFPFIFTFSKVLDILFKNSNKKKVANTIKIEEFIPIEENEEETEEKVEDKKLSVEDYLKQKYEDFYFVKKQKEKEDEQARALIREIQKNNLRSLSRFRRYII